MSKIIHKRGGFSITGSGGGGKGGGSARTPVEEPDSLHSTSYAALIDVLSSGTVEGPVHADRPLLDIFLDGTPIQNEDGSLNFRDVQVEVRHGTQDQAHIPGFPASVVTTAVGVKVDYAQPWTQAISNLDLSAVRITLRWPLLVRVVDSGQKVNDRVGVSVEYAIDLSVDGGSFQTVKTDNVTGKSKIYERTYRIDLPPADIGWTVRVRRLTPDSSSSIVEDEMYVQTYAEVIDGKFRFPMTAHVGIKVDAEQFSNIPTRSYRWRGVRVRIPSNYDPQARTYSGTWDGTFKTGFTNNPVWIFLDMLTSTLHGLGDRVSIADIDRYALYQISALCDQLVPDGMGGMEPRFVCNVYLQGRADALRVLNDLASVFRGMSYWANDQVVAVADAPSDPVYTFTNANVIDGRFSYTGSDMSTRNTVALVSWNDPTDFYRSKVEIVNDDEGIRRYGIRKTELVAFGCTSRGQAQRVGLYHLYTARAESGGLTFRVGLEGVIPQPGDIIRIADANRAGRRIGGRIRSATATQITLDTDKHPVRVGDQITVNLPSGQQQTRTVTSVEQITIPAEDGFAGSEYSQRSFAEGGDSSTIQGSEITVSPGFSPIPEAEAVWSIDSSDLVTQLARVISVRESGPMEFEISAVHHHPDKFAAIDTGARLDPLPVSVAPPRVQPEPSLVEIDEYGTYHQGTTRHTAEITWDKPEYAVAYDVQWRRDDSDWVVVPRTTTRLVEIRNIYSGRYVARVRAINSLDIPSLWTYSEPTDLDGIVGAPPTVTSLTTTGEIMAIRLDWTYPPGPSIIEKIQIRASLDNNFSNGYDVTEVAYPGRSYTLYGLGYSTEMWFWVRLVDKNGTVGPWYPASGGPGVYGIPNQDPEALLEYLEGQIGEGQLAPDLIEEITEGITEETLETIVGDLTGDDVLDAKWFAGDDDGSFVGTVTVTSAYNEGDYREAQRSTSLAAGFDQSLAVIRETMRVVANESSASAQKVDLLAVSVGEVEGAVEITAQALADLDGAVSSSWQVKTQVRSDGRVVQAGVAVGAAVRDDGTSRSEILLMADTIGFLNSLNGQIHAPFIFDVANDTAFLNTVFIQDATISFAKIMNNIQSTNFNSGSAGWRLDKSGNFEANQGTFRGDLVAAGGTFSGNLSAAGGTFSGTLTANAINAVQTINVAGNAVSIASSWDFGSPVVSFGTSWSDWQSMSMNVPESSVLSITLQVDSDAYISGPSNGRIAQAFRDVQVLVNGTEVGLWTLMVGEPNDSDNPLITWGEFHGSYTAISHTVSGNVNISIRKRIANGSATSTTKLKVFATARYR